MSLFDEPVPEPDATLCRLIDIHGYELVAERLRYLAPTVEAPSAPARRGDPVTSHLAAEHEPDVGRFGYNSRQAKLLYLMSTGDFTDQQAAMRIVGATAAVSALEGCRRRMSDLRAVHFLYDTGKRHKNTGSDEDSIVWGITEAGRQALISLDDTGWSR